MRRFRQGVLASITWTETTWLMPSRKAKATIGRPVISKKLNVPVFVIAVPVRDTQGKVIGALAGVTDLGKPNFLDKVTENHYGKSGGYVLLIPKDRLIVTATDKSRIMQPLPAPGINPTIDRFIQVMRVLPFTPTRLAWKCWALPRKFLWQTGS